MVGILLSGTNSLLPSFSSVTNLLPHNCNRQIETLQMRTLHMRTHCSFAGKKQQHDNKLKLVVVNKKHMDPPKIYVLSTEEEEEDNFFAISSENGVGLPVASCNELLLTEVGYNELAIWKPNDDKVIKTLPQSTVPRSPFVVDESAYLFGFGFDPRASSQQQEHDYKVIRFVRFDYVDGRDSYMDDCVVDLYSHKTHSWKSIPFPHPRTTLLMLLPSSIYINGFCYWPASYGSDLFVIVPFDFANDTFPSALIPGPTFPSALIPEVDIVRDDCNRYLLVEFEGSLGVIKYYILNEKTVELELWVWNNNNNHNNNADSWSRRGEWVIRVPGEIDERSDRRCRLLGLFKNDQLYFKDSNRELWLFDCAKQKLKNLGLYAEQGLLSFFPYVERSAN